MTKVEAAIAMKLITLPENGFQGQPNRLLNKTTPTKFLKLQTANLSRDQNSPKNKHFMSHHNI